MEIRTRNVVRRYVSTDGGGTCKRPKVYDNREYYYRRYAQRKPFEKRDSSSYRIIEPREPLRSRSNFNTLLRQDLSPIRSQSFKMRLPYIKRSFPAKENYEPRPRGRARSPRLFVVDSAPEIRYAWPREKARSPSPEIRCVSPRRRPSPRRFSPRPLEREREPIVIPDRPRESRPRELIKAPRPPRERSPVVEREPVRQRRNVQIHQSPERRRERSGSSGRRQVRFSEDIGYAEDRVRAHGRYEPRQPESYDGIRDDIRNHVFQHRMADVDDNPRYRRLSPDRSSYQRVNLPRNRRAEAAVFSSERGRPRPRIIQDGDRDISEVSDRLYAEARRKRSQERALHDLTPHSSSRWRRRFDDSRDFSSEDESYLRSTGTRRYNWRWR
ncbi:hypothetical protein BJX99DRAFT_233265 [Aspergillus californicus]